jgi:hypothetical protein
LVVAFGIEALLLFDAEVHIRAAVVEWLHLFGCMGGGVRVNSLLMVAMKVGSVTEE